MQRAAGARTVTAAGPARADGGYPVDLLALVDDYLERLDFGADRRAARLVEAMRYSLLAGGKRIRPVLTLATARSRGADPAARAPRRRRARARAHVLAHPRRPAGDRRRHAAARPPHLSRGLRRGHRDPRRRRPLRRGVPRAAHAAAGRPGGAARGRHGDRRRHRRAGHGRRPVHGRGRSGGDGRRPARAARPEDRPPHRGGGGLRRRAHGGDGPAVRTAPSPRRWACSSRSSTTSSTRPGSEQELGKSVGKDREQDKTTYVSRFGMDGGARPCGRGRGARRRAPRRAARATPRRSARSRRYIRDRRR